MNYLVVAYTRLAILEDRQLFLMIMMYTEKAAIE